MKTLPGPDLRLLVFDWDGTLMDSISTICGCLAVAFAAAGLPDRGEAYKEIIGLGLDEALAMLAPGIGDRQREQVLSAYRDCFFTSSMAEMPLFPGVEPALRDLAAAGFHLAVATGKSRRGLDRMLAAHPALAQCIGASRCADESRSKPHPQMLHELLTHFDLPPSAALMVGDSIHDMEMAVAAGVLPVGVCCGVHDAQRLRAHGAQVCLADLQDLPAWLRREQRNVVGA
ncbi:HAD family hydrolase [Acidithiobacillus sp.]